MKTQKIFLDLETGGVDPQLHSILSIGLIDNRNFKTYSELIKPQINKCVDQEALDYNGLNIEKCYKEGKKLREVLDYLILNLFTEPIIYLIGHKIEFDYKFLLNAIKETSPYMNLPTIVLIDTKEMYKKFNPNFFLGKKFVTQKMIYEEIFNEKLLEDENKALVDINMTFRIYNYLIENI